MRTLSERLREARVKLGLSQGYVANCLGIGRASVAQIELGNRKVSAEELSGFSRLYHISADRLLGNNLQNNNQAVFARGFDALTENDQQEILNLIAFKHAMAERGM